jgi:hypothetical protein
MCGELMKKTFRAVQFNWKKRREPFEEKFLIFHRALLLVKKYFQKV